MSEKGKMVSSDEAEALAQEAIRAYLEACRLQTMQDGGKALMKLISLAGVCMCGMVGVEEAVNRMASTTAFIAKNGHKVKMGRVRVQ